MVLWEGGVNRVNYILFPNVIVSNHFKFSVVRVTVVFFCEAKIRDGHFSRFFVKKGKIGL